MKCECRECRGSGEIPCPECDGQGTYEGSIETITVRVVENPQHTKNLFGPISEIAGKELELMERNGQGDCLCIFTGRLGTNLVDVDHRDVSQNDRAKRPIFSDALSELAALEEKLADDAPSAAGASGGS